MEASRETGPDGSQDGHEDEPGDEAAGGPPGAEAPSKEEAPPLTGPAVGRFNVLRRLYYWVLSWAFTPYGVVALVAFTFAESSAFPVPTDPLLMALCLGNPRRSFRFAGWATFASVAGGAVGYLIGWAAWSALGGFFFDYVPGVTPDTFGEAAALYHEWDFWAVFVAGFTPIPYKVFTLAAGVFGINFAIFLLASALSRGVRFFLIAGLIHRYGPPVGRFIDRYFNLLTIIFAVLLVGGFGIIRLVL